MADLFAGRPARLNAWDYVRGLLAPLERKNCASIAEWAEHASPDQWHCLPERAVWDERALRVRLATLAVECLGDQGILNSAVRGLWIAAACPVPVLVKPCGATSSKSEAFTGVSHPRLRLRQNGTLRRGGGRPQPLASLDHAICRPIITRS